MSFHIRKIPPGSPLLGKKVVPQITNKKSRINPGQKLQSRTLSTSTQSPESAKLKVKSSLQTILSKISTYVQQLNLSTTSWCLYDIDKDKYIGFRENHEREIASLTKIMTTIISIQFLSLYEIHQDFYIKVTESSTKMIGTSAELKPHTWIKVWDLLYGIMLPSGNDAAFLISEVIGFLSKLQAENISKLSFLDLTRENTSLHTSTFVKMMNNKAIELKLSNTNFSNPHGLQNALNISSPKDLIKLSIYASKNSLFRKVMNTDTIRYYYLEENKDIPDDVSIEEVLQKHVKSCRKRWWNTNRLLDKGWEGVKTGHTAAAGGCLSSLKNGIYIVVLNCKDNQTRFNQTQKIYSWYIEKKTKRQLTENSSTD